MYNNTMKTMIKNQIIPIIILKFLNENDICYDNKTKSIKKQCVLSLVIQSIHDFVPNESHLRTSLL